MATILDIPTPALLLDPARLKSNTEFMTGRAWQLGVKLRPHMKTAKSVKVARFATAGNFGGITVSTLAEARYFLANGFKDITYAVGMAPGKIAEAVALTAQGAELKVLTDNLAVAGMIAEQAAGLGVPLGVLIEIDCGDHRGGLLPEAHELVQVAEALRDRPGVELAGVLTHAGHSYACFGTDKIAEVAEAERKAAVTAADQLREAGFACPVVSVGSTPTATHARNLEGITEMRPGVYMFGDLHQVALGSMPEDRVAVSVLTTVIGVYPDRVIVDAGGLALSKDISAQAINRGAGYGQVCNLACEPLPGASVAGANQEHGIVKGSPPSLLRELKIGDRLRILPNHICMTAAAHPGYYVLTGGNRVDERWARINGWEQWGATAAQKR